METPKIKKVYVDVESKYIEVTFENGHKHQLLAASLEEIGIEKADPGYEEAYQVEMHLDLL
jgi:hypothetical protein